MERQDCIYDLEVICDFAREVCGFDTDQMTVSACIEAVKYYCTKKHDDLDQRSKERLEHMKKVFNIVSPSKPDTVVNVAAAEKKDLEALKEALKNAPVQIIDKNAEPHIKDSGDRTQFASGAVRDMHEGKGRCDLLPLDVVGSITNNRILSRISEFQDDGLPHHLTQALSIADDALFSNKWTMFLEVAKHFEEGAKKYGDNNWRKGIPVKCYIDSAVRHYLKYLRGDKDEPHDRAFCWNILCAIWTCKHKPELNDYARKEDAANEESSN